MKKVTTNTYTSTIEPLTRFFCLAYELSRLGHDLTSDAPETPSGTQAGTLSDLGRSLDATSDACKTSTHLGRSPDDDWDTWRTRRTYFGQVRSEIRLMWTELRQSRVPALREGVINSCDKLQQMVLTSSCILLS